MRSRPSTAAKQGMLLAASLALAGCEREAPSPARAAEPGPEPAQSLAPPAVVERADLLRAIDDAASAYAAGRRDASPDLAGRRFVLREAFGCGGPGPEEQAGFARWRPLKDQAIEISLRPADWRSYPPVADAGAAWEVVQGFWIARPWLRAEGCPVTPSARAPEEATPEATSASTAPTAGLAAVFEQGSSRSGRREGPYAFTIRPEVASTATSGSYRLVLEGRFTAFPGGGAIRCWSASADQRPVCIAAAEVDRVAFEDDAGKLVREWRPQ